MNVNSDPSSTYSDAAARSESSVHSNHSSSRNQEPVSGLADRVLATTAYQDAAQARTIENAFLEQDSAAKISAAAQHVFQQSAVESLANESLQSSEFGATLRYSVANQNWRDVECIQRAGNGQRGAWFYTHHIQGSVVVKGQEGADCQVMGTVFLRAMSLHAPDARMVPRQSPEGQQLSALGDAQGLNGRNPTHYIIIDRVKGPAYDDLTSSEGDIQLVIQSLISFGELAVYDLVLGNFDRMNLMDLNFNAGNIMFQDGFLRPIDTDCQALEDDRLLFAKRALSKIKKREGDADFKIAKLLARQLGVSVEALPLAKIQEGMDLAISKLIKLTENLEENKQLFLESCNERGCPLPAFPAQLEELLLHVRNC